jgi:hypothetical protein
MTGKRYLIALSANKNGLLWKRVKSIKEKSEKGKKSEDRS